MSMAQYGGGGCVGRGGVLSVLPPLGTCHMTGWREHGMNSDARIEFVVRSNGRTLISVLVAGEVDGFIFSQLRVGIMIEI